MKPIEFYNWAVGMAGNVATEAERRTVVNRLYYGLHHEACCRYFRAHPTATPLDKWNRYAGLSITFNSATDPVSMAIGNLLNDLRQLRSQADYELSNPMRFRGIPITSQALLNVALRYGQDLLEELEAYSPGDAIDGCSCLVR